MGGSEIDLWVISLYHANVMTLLSGRFMVVIGFFTGDLQQHLQIMFTLLRPEDTIRLVTTIIQT